MTQNNQPARCRRRRLFADTQIQGGLCLRVALYWFACQAVTLLTILGLASLYDGGFEKVSGLVFPAFVFGVLTLPLALFDLVVFSNKFAGPLKNFRDRLKRLAKGGQSEPIEFRKHDFLSDVRDNFNLIQAQLNKAAVSTSEKDSQRSDFLTQENRADEDIENVSQVTC